MTAPQVLEPICLIVSAQHAPVAGLFPLLTRRLDRQPTSDRPRRLPYSVCPALHTRAARSRHPLLTHASGDALSPDATRIPVSAPFTRSTMGSTVSIPHWGHSDPRGPGPSAGRGGRNLGGGVGYDYQT